MIHTAPENKYRFHMQVSARAIPVADEGRAIENVFGNAASRTERPRRSTYVHGNMLLDPRLGHLRLIDGQIRDG
jgi:hypothetical protein